jgi:hypothetical protein
LQDVIGLFRATIADETTAHARVGALASGEYCNGYWHGEPGMVWRP